MTEEKKLTDKARENIETCLSKWDNRDYWEKEIRYGDGWSGSTVQAAFNTRKIVQNYILPFIPDRALDILEIAPGGGRMTAELVPLSRSLVIVDVCQACIDVCKERFKHADNMEFYVNDGSSLEMVEDGSRDLIVSFDSFVHIDPEVIEVYVSQFASKLRDFGLVWLTHASGKSKDEWRSDMSKEKMAEMAERHGLVVKAQIGFIPRRGDDGFFWRDYISILKKVPADQWDRGRHIEETLDMGFFVQQM